MSSLDKLPDWTVFTKREVPFVCEMLSPASEVSALLQDRQIALETTRREIEVVRQAGLAALAQQAVYVVQLEKVLEQMVPGETQPGQNAQSRNYRRLRIVQEQMLTALKEVGLEVIVPKGKAFDEITDEVDIVEWRHEEKYTAEVVAEVMEPIVKYQGKVVRIGRVVMGAPMLAEHVQE